MGGATAWAPPQRVAKCCIGTLSWREAWELRSILSGTTCWRRGVGVVLYSFFQLLSLQPLAAKGNSMLSLEPFVCREAYEFVLFNQTNSSCSEESSQDNMRKM